MPKYCRFTLLHQVRDNLGSHAAAGPDRVVSEDGFFALPALCQ